jgi:hypothetical protein
MSERTYVNLPAREKIAAVQDDPKNTAEHVDRLQSPLAASAIKIEISPEWRISAPAENVPLDEDI